MVLMEQEREMGRGERKQETAREEGDMEKARGEVEERE